MQSKTEHNTFFNDNSINQREYNYNFVNTPWDDRSQRSKICIVCLLCSIFVATMAVAIHNFIVFYRGFEKDKLYHTSLSEINCNLVRVDEYRFAARIHSKTSLELICIGAMVSKNSVLANEVCLRSGPIRLYLGSLTDHFCRRGFSVDVIETIPHDGVVTRYLVLLTTRENLLECGSVIRVGLNTSRKHREVDIIGRPFRGGKTLSFQHAVLISTDNLTHSTGLSINNMNKNNLICAKHLSKCPVRAGDLLVQRGRLIGIASKSTHDRENNQMACFANLSLIFDELRDLGVNVELDLL